MTIAEYGANVLSWLSQTWPYWLAFSIVILAGYCWYWYLFEQRTYRAVDGKPQVKHGRVSQWVDLDEHLEEHGIDGTQLGR